MSGICDTCKRKECYMEHDGDDSCPLYLKGKQSNYKRLFGTPERAARTLIKVVVTCEDNFETCEKCPLFEAPSCASNFEGGDYDALLEWLRGDAE